MNYNVKAIVFGLGLISSVLVMQAKDISVKSEDKLERIARRNELSVVLFYNEDRQTRRDNELRRRLDDLKENFRILSKALRYQDAEVAFISANIAKGDLQGLLQDLGTQKTPTVVLYKNGSVLRDNNKKVEMLSGFVTQGDLKKFINDNFDADIDDIIEDKAQRRKERLEEDRLRAYYYGPSLYYSPWYYGYGYPYGYGFGWPYRRWGYPYGGVGFGFGIGI